MSPPGAAGDHTTTLHEDLLDLTAIASAAIAEVQRRLDRSGPSRAAALAEDAVGPIEALHLALEAIVHRATRVR